MKKFFSLLSILGIVLLSSCSKEQYDKFDNLTPFTLTASVGDLTKTSYTDDAGILKVQWDANEIITLVKTQNDLITAMYNLTSVGEAGRTIAEFTGSVDLTGENVKFIAVYPPVSDPTASSSKVAMPEGCTYIINNVSLGQGYVTNTVNATKYIYQVANNDPSHLKYIDAMYGEVSATSTSAALTNLDKITSVLKLVLTLPEGAVGKQARSVSFELSNSPSGYNYLHSVNYWIKASSSKNRGSSTYSYAAHMNLGNASEGFVIPDDRTITLYLPLIYARNWENGATETITLNVSYNDGGVIKTDSYSKSVVNTQEYVLQQGYIYTISATLE